MLTFDRANLLISYDSDTGLLRRKKNHGPAREGRIAGTKNNYGYLVVSIDNKNYPSHRIAWLLHTGALPKNQIDHINGVKTDNRIVNLREATSAENRRNIPIDKSSTTGIKGVTWHKQSNKWRAMICVDYKFYHLGLFEKIEDAMMIYQKASIDMHKEFSNLDSHRPAYRAAMEALK